MSVNKTMVPIPSYVGNRTWLSLGFTREMTFETSDLLYVLIVLVILPAICVMYLLRFTLRNASSWWSTARSQPRTTIAVFVLAVTVCSVGGICTYRYFERWQLFTERTSCVSQLHLLLVMKRAYAAENGLTNGAAVSLDLVVPDHMKDYICPSGGQYSVNSVGRIPTCTYTQAVWYRRTYRKDGIWGKMVPWYHNLPSEMNEYEPNNPLDQIPETASGTDQG